jgi:molecular chaperone GrpE
VTNSAQLDVPEPEFPDKRGMPETGAEEQDRPPESFPVTGSDNELAAVVSAQLVSISGQLKQLHAMFEAKTSEDEQQRQWVTQLTSELAQYRDDFIFKNIISKVLHDLIALYDTLDQTLDPVVLEGIPKEDLVARLRNLRRQILKAFERQGVERIKSEAQAPFDEAEQEAVDVRPVDRSADNEKVLESVRCGFRYGTRLLRPESVIVGRYESKDKESDG